LPSNSDAVLMISQHIQALEQFKTKYYTKDSEDLFGDFSWKTKK